MDINRKWSMPNKNTFDIKPIKELINKYVQKLPSNATIVDPFANKNEIATITNDLDPQYNTTYHMDATDFLNMLDDNSADMVLYDPPYCYDGNTMLMTDKGFKWICEITKDDLLATLNTETNHIEYQNATEVIQKQYKGEMIKVVSDDINLFVTPNHRCYVADARNGDFKWVLAKDLVNAKSQYYIKKDGLFEGIEQLEFTFPAVGKHAEKTVSMNSFLKLLGFYLSYGRCKMRFSKDTDNKYDRIVSFPFCASHIRGEIVSIAREFGCKAVLHQKSIDIHNEQLWAYFKSLGTIGTRCIPQSLKSLSAEQLSLLVDYMLLGQNACKHSAQKYIDTKHNPLLETNTFVCRSLNLHNDFSEIALKAGHKISTFYDNQYNRYGVCLLTQNHFSFKSEDITPVPYNGFVYCVSVPNTTLLVNRGGKVFWCGNSPRQVSECYKNLNQTVNMETTQASYWSKQKEQIARITKKGGYAVTCSWNSGGIGKKYGFEIVEILLVPHGGWHNDTIVVVERKI